MAMRGKWFVVMWCTLAVVNGSPGPRCPTAAAPHLCQETGSPGDEYFYVVSGNKMKISFDGPNYYMKCPENVSLDSELLPRFEQEVVVRKVRLDACTPPDSGYFEALSKLNLSVLYVLELTNVPAQPPLRSQHFENLNITALVVKGTTFLTPESNFLSSLVTLRDLRLQDVELKSVSLTPIGLRTLELKQADLEGITSVELARLESLTRLVLEEKRPLRVELTGSAVRSVQVTAPQLQLWAGDAENMTLRNVVSPEMKDGCSALRRMEAVGGGGEVPACGELRVLLVEGPRSPTAPPPPVSTTLTRARLRRCGLRNLPPRWLAKAAELVELDLSFNLLENLPIDTFVGATRLQRLVVSHNRLSATALAALPPLAASLTHLELTANLLGDLCARSRWSAAFDPNAVSPLRDLRALVSLKLAGTGAARICRDWRLELTHLVDVDLAGNNITQLEYADLQWPRDAAAGVARVSLAPGPRVTLLQYTREDYNTVVAGGGAPAAHVTARWALACDCLQYWVARAMRDRPAHAPGLRAQARCASAADRTILLANVPPENLECEVTPEQGCPRGCACAASPAGTTLQCAGAGLREAPRVSSPLPPARRLLLPRNNISSLPPQLFADTLQELDVSDNRLEWLPAAAVGGTRRLWAGGNPLRCDCALRPLLLALAARPTALVDPARALCFDGRRLMDAASKPPVCAAGAAELPAAAWVGIGIALLLLLVAVALGAVLIRPAWRQRFKKFLFERGPWPGWLSPFEDSPEEAAARPFDAFVSYSHQDAAYAYELAARLEGEGRRLCLHERDWGAGEWIPAQISASVARARRTVVLVSRHFLESRWARAEFREAYSAALAERRPRLMLLLLPELTPADVPPHEPELRAYLARATYLRWDDPAFWTRIARAVPSRPAPASPPAPAPAPAPSPHAPPAA